VLQTSQWISFRSGLKTFSSQGCEFLKPFRFIMYDYIVKLELRLQDGNCSLCHWVQTCPWVHQASVQKGTKSILVKFSWIVKLTASIYWVIECIELLHYHYYIYINTHTHTVCCLGSGVTSVFTFRQFRCYFHVNIQKTSTVAKWIRFQHKSRFWRKWKFWNPAYIRIFNSRLAHIFLRLA
jgi:hypothetical protein